MSSQSTNYTLYVILNKIASSRCEVLMKREHRCFFWNVEDGGLSNGQTSFGLRSSFISKYYCKKFRFSFAVFG